MPIRSMTGYGQAICEHENYRVRAEIRSVNHRFAEYQIRLAKEHLALDDVVRTVLAEYVRRGRCDVYVLVDSIRTPQKSVAVDWDLFAQLVELEVQARERGLPVVATNWFEHADVIRIASTEIDMAVLEQPVRIAVTQACVNLAAMRSREGHRLATDLSMKVKHLDDVVQQLQQGAPSARLKLQAKLQERLLGLGLEVAEERVLSEAALLAERAAVDEELVRLCSHLAEFGTSLAQGSPVGRRLDFIVQEMHREVNTIASKSSDLLLSRGVLDAKTIVEQLREQVQNIE